MSQLIALQFSGAVDELGLWLFMPVYIGAHFGWANEAAAVDSFWYGWSTSLSASSNGKLILHGMGWAEGGDCGANKGMSGDCNGINAVTLLKSTSRVNCQSGYGLADDIGPGLDLLGEFTDVQGLVEDVAGGIVSLADAYGSVLPPVSELPDDIQEGIIDLIDGLPFDDLPESTTDALNDVIDLCSNKNHPKPGPGR